MDDFEKIKAVSLTDSTVQVLTKKCTRASWKSEAFCRPRATEQAAAFCISIISFFKRKTRLRAFLRRVFVRYLCCQINRCQRDCFWADANNRVIPDPIDFTNTFFVGHTFLNILTRYCIFTAEEMQMVIRPYQIAATENPCVERPFAGDFILCIILRCFLQHTRRWRWRGTRSGLCRCRHR